MLAEAREVKAVEGASRVGTDANPQAQGLPRAWKMAARGTRGLISEFPREAEKPEYSVLVPYFEMLLKKKREKPMSQMKCICGLPSCDFCFSAYPPGICLVLRKCSSVGLPRRTQDAQLILNFRMKPKKFFFFSVTRSQAIFGTYLF